MVVADILPQLDTKASATIMKMYEYLQNHIYALPFPEIKALSLTKLHTYGGWQNHVNNKCLLGLMQIFTIIHISDENFL